MKNNSTVSIKSCRRCKIIPDFLNFACYIKMCIAIVISLVSSVIVYPASNLHYRMNNLNDLLLSNPSEWLVCGTTSWQDLKNYLPEAKMAGVSVKVMLLPPFQSTPVCTESNYSEPFGEDYILWAQEIGTLSLRYSNLTEFGIYELQENLTLGYLRQSYIDSVIVAGLSINPRLQFNSSIIDTTAPDVPTSLSALLANVNSNATIPEDLVLEVNDRWLDIGGSDWVMQAIVDSEKITIAANPLFDTTNATPSVGRFEIIYGDDFSGIANGHPRAQQSALKEQYGGYEYPYGKEYRISWDMYMPADFDVNESSYARTNTILTQFRNSGSDAPLFSFGIDSVYYYFTQNIDTTVSGAGYYNSTDFGDPLGDRGKWQHWEMKWLFDSTAAGWATLYHNGVKVDSNKARTVPYNYPSYYDDNYFSVDLYTDALGITDSLEIYFDNIETENVTDGTAMQTCTYGDEQDTIAHFVNLSWVNPVATYHDSTYIFSSLTNDITTAVKIATVFKANTTYRDTLAGENIRYYWLKARDIYGNVSKFSSFAVDTTSVYAPN